MDVIPGAIFSLPVLDPNESRMYWYFGEKYDKVKHSFFSINRMIFLFGRRKQTAIGLNVNPETYRQLATDEQNSFRFPALINTELSPVMIWILLCNDSAGIS